MKYRKKSLLIEASQWFTNGDHSEVQSFSSVEMEAFPSLEIPETRFCSDCGNAMSKHGVLDGLNGEEIICPGDYIVTDRNGACHRLTRGEFESQYELYAPPPRPPKEMPLSDTEQRLQRSKRRL